MKLYNICMILVVLASLAVRVEADDRLDEVIIGHREYNESLRKIHAKYEIVTDWHESKTGSVKRRVEWFQNGPSIRWKERTDRLMPALLPSGQVELREQSVDLEVVSHNGKSVSFARTRTAGKKEEYGSQRKLPGESDPGFADLWSRANFVVFDVQRTTILDLLEDKQWRKVVRRVEYDGKPHIHITAYHKAETIEIWFAPHENYLAKRKRTYSGTFNPLKPYSEQVVESIQNASKSRNLVFPKKVTMTDYGVDAGKSVPVNWSTTQFTYVSIDVPMDANTFAQPKIPRGTLVVDDIKGITYQSDEKGEPINPKSVRRLPPPIVEEPEPPTSDWQWYLYLGLAVLGGLLMSFGFYRWWRARSVE
ncbi:MAG: hypothetical protein SNJ75_03750 [Gemmataceae bacterium]